MYSIYTVLNGDTLDMVASKYNTTVDVLAKLNGLDLPFDLMPGMLLVVPNNINPYFDYYEVKKGDTLYKIARDFNMDYNTLASLNGLEISDYIYPNQVIMVPRRDVNYYITKEEDTLLDLVNNLNANLSNIIRDNDKIYLLPGQLMVVKMN